MSQATLPGFSDAADYLTKTEQELNDRQRESVTFSRQTAIDAIWEVWLPCKEPNWDGENAIAISETTFENAYRLIDALPHGFPSPTVTAEPDGHLNLEWYKNPLLRFGMTMAEILPVGILISLICAALLRKKEFLSRESK